jgi:hypothetical protein
VDAGARAPTRPRRASTRWTPRFRLVMRRSGVSNPQGGSSIAPPAADPRWGPYLDARSHVVAELADQVRLNAEAEASAWAAEPNAHMPAELIADVRVWRAATRVDVSELQPHRATPARSRHPNLPRANGDRPWRQLLATQIPALLRTHSCRNWQRLSGACCRIVLQIADVLFEVVPGICPVPGLRHLGERRLGKEVQTTFGGCLLHAQARRTPKGVRRR